MTPEEFIDKWRRSELTERAAAQSHFNDLCSLLGVPSPTDADQRATEYTFEKSTRKIGGAVGFADVWKRRCFAWEYKGKRRNLVEAYAQLKQYADAFDNPPCSSCRTCRKFVFTRISPIPSRTSMSFR